MSSTTVQLLNDDGTASMATALLMSHHAFRRDIALFAGAVRRVVEGDHAKAAALREEWQGYRGALHGHHEIEDNGIFPGLRAEHVELAGVFDQLSAHHRQIDPLLERGDEAFAALDAKAARAAAVVAELSALLDQHLALEEAHVPAFLRAAKAFPPPPGDAEAELYAQGFAWSSRGVSPQVLEQLDVILPPALKDRLPAARAAFEQRCARVWGPTTPGASRTSIPDSLPGGG
jgi:hemerythrin-like domain-containing protein